MLTDPAYIFLWRALAIFWLIGALLGVVLALAADLQASIPGAAQSRGESLGFHATYQPLAGSQYQHRALVLSAPSRGRSNHRAGGVLYFHLFWHAVRQGAHAATLELESDGSGKAAGQFA